MLSSTLKKLKTFSVSFYNAQFFIKTDQKTIRTQQKSGANRFLQEEEEIFVVGDFCTAAEKSMRLTVFFITASMFSSLEKSARL